MSRIKDFSRYGVYEEQIEKVLSAYKTLVRRLVKQYGLEGDEDYDEAVRVAADMLFTSLAVVLQPVDNQGSVH